MQDALKNTFPKESLNFAHGILLVYLHKSASRKSVKPTVLILEGYTLGVCAV